jgi:DNA polymerase
MADELANAIAELRDRIAYLGELGVESLAVEIDAAASVGGARVVKSAPKPEYVPVPDSGEFRSEIPDLRPAENSKPRPDQGDAPARPAVSRLASLPSLKARKPSQFFDKYNPREEDRSKEIGEARSEVANPRIEVLAERADITETIAEIQAEIGKDCTRCKLSQLGRSQVVNSVGNVTASLMFCGEAPGADEDKFGEPFVGRAGQLLTDIIEKGLEIPRKDVFIGNINRCRPPGNRAPEPDESAVCKPFLLREIAVVRPKVIVVLGATAAQNLLETKVPIGKLRGKFHDYHGSKVMPTFHPAYLLRDPNKKREVWEDMKLVKEYLRTIAH